MGLPPVSRRDVLKFAGVAPAALGIGAMLDAPQAAAGIAGMAVFLDAGHNAVNDSSLTQQVPNGRGGTKQCNTSGAATDDGYPEHAFNWAVVGLIQGALDQMGVRTQLSRANDSSAGPCVDQRAAEANAMHPDAIVSIHADGGPPSGRGFHVNYSSPPLNAAQSGPAMQLAHAMRDALVAAGYQPSTYIGSDGLYGRDDLAGLNLAEYPAVLVELGNMKNADEAAQMESPDGRARYAAAVTNGITAYLSAKAPRVAKVRFAGARPAIGTALLSHTAAGSLVPSAEDELETLVHGHRRQRRRRVSLVGIHKSVNVIRRSNRPRDRRQSQRGDRRDGVRVRRRQRPPSSIGPGHHQSHPRQDPRLARAASSVALMSSVFSLGAAASGTHCKAAGAHSIAACHD